MKIRFSSSKEQQPTQDQGLKVLYAPGKRLAFKLRWYLILLAVTSPLLFLVGREFFGLWLIEAPAQLHLPSSELRAREAGQVERVLGRPGDRVEVGQLLLRMDNPEWRARLALLAEPSTLPSSAVQPGMRERERHAVQRLLDSAESRLGSLRGLLAAGAATRGEVQQAQDERDRRQRDLLEFERRESLPADATLERQRRLESGWLQARLQGMELKAGEAGVISEVLVGEGENVGPGTPLMRLQRLGDAELWVYLDPRHAAYASPGQPFRLRLPDGTWLSAEVVRMVEDAVPVPVELREAFSAPSRNLRLLARVRGEWPAFWRVDRLGLKARFPHRWGWLDRWAVEE
ncbi:HlyD family efflux transporter periplasmic adaptor subunit [Pseudomonas sp. BN102]|uniref:HlyD family secretion protein n=1 Tax=Pseudomonas sp. BN102 TaxID=2567886 RepID=UPI002456C3A9|nr:HlyD family efflux transporter periplasmic adaptor subunit [Pseudomonas sp. BN102]MDH4607811.1 HlyD family efflux transporter periplasmic adaptor subunit [Pseudomonas sp. BN102]